MLLRISNLLKNIFVNFILPCFFLLVFTQCASDSSKSADKIPVQKTVNKHENDPFKNSMPQSQFFEIDSKADHVIEGKNGTLLVLPKGAFKNKKGEIIEENVQIELKEALGLDEMLLANLTTTSNGKLLETDGMIYFSATANGEQLQVNKQNPVYIEIPTKLKKPGMMVYKGNRDKDGNMNWFGPRFLNNYLVPVDIKLLDFLPDGFMAEVEKGMPYKKHKTATKPLADSLYYSLAVSDGTRLTNSLSTLTTAAPFESEKDLLKTKKQPKQKFTRNLDTALPVTVWQNSVKFLTNDEYEITFTAKIPRGWEIPSIKPQNKFVSNLDVDFNKNTAVKLIGDVKEQNLVWSGTDNGYVYRNTAIFTQKVKLLKNETVLTGNINSQLLTFDMAFPPSDFSFSINLPGEKCGIDPAIIKTISSNKYQNTFVSTREFEQRLQTIFKTCDNAVLETYIKNLDKNLYELDEMAAQKVKDPAMKRQFLTYSEFRLGNVEGAEKTAQLLKKHYEKRLAQVKKELENAKEKLVKQLDKKNKEAKKVLDEYNHALKKREKYRMDAYGFKYDTTGWINIDKPAEVLKEPITTTVTVTNGKDFDRVHTYIVARDIKSIYSLYGPDKVKFTAYNISGNEMLMPTKPNAICIAIAYKGDTPYLAKKELVNGYRTQHEVTLQLSDEAELKTAISEYDTYSKENRISRDLEYMQKFYVEQLRQKALIKESISISKLNAIAYPCCNDGREALYESSIW